MRRFAVSEIVAVFRLHGEERQRALIAELARGGAPALAALAGICEGEQPPSVVRWAVEALGRFRGARVEALLKRALKHPAMSVRLHALLAVRALDEPRLASALRPLLRDESGGIRVNALAMVAELKPRWLAVELKRALRDEKAYVRHLAGKLLARPAVSAASPAAPARRRSAR
jgi:HEAT repeat protein